jgi:uncharacterized membrane protein
MNKKIQNALLEAIWIMRWNKNKTAMTAVLEIEEAIKICDDIVKELGKVGYVITKRTMDNMYMAAKTKKQQGKVLKNILNKQIKLGVKKTKLK